MERSDLIEKVKEYVKSKLSSVEGGHDYWHAMRVWSCAKKIANTISKCNIKIIEVAALTHDLIDEKIFPDTEKELTALNSFLSSVGFLNQEIEISQSIIKTISYKDNLASTHKSCIESKIVQDADRLDAMGAIGIARAFSYGGHRGRELYNPLNPPKVFINKNEYLTAKSSTINHFHEKLLLLKDLLHTEKAKEMAQERHNFMIQFLEEFHKEWNTD